MVDDAPKKFRLATFVDVPANVGVEIDNTPAVALNTAKFAETVDNVGKARIVVGNTTVTYPVVPPVTIPGPNLS